MQSTDPAGGNALQFDWAWATAGVIAGLFGSFLLFTAAMGVWWFVDEWPHPDAGYSCALGVDALLGTFCVVKAVAWLRFATRHGSRRIGKSMD